MKVEWKKYSSHHHAVINDNHVIDLRERQPCFWYLGRSNDLIYSTNLPEGMAWDSQEAKDWAFAIWSMS